MRFGFMLFTRDLHAVGDVARLAEERGFDLIGVADSPALTFDPYMALTLAALATRRARIGTAVTNPQTRHPLIIANLAASLEALAPGRSFLGLGTGWSGVRHAGRPRPGWRRSGSTVRQVRGLLAGEEVEIRRCTGHPAYRRPAGADLARGERAESTALRRRGRRHRPVQPRHGAGGAGRCAAVDRRGRVLGRRTPSAIEPWLFIPAAVSPDRAAAIEEVKPATVSSGAYVLRGDLAAKRVPTGGRSRASGSCFGSTSSASTSRAGRARTTDWLSGLVSPSTCSSASPSRARPRTAAARSTGLRAAGIANICFNLGTVNDLAETLDLFGREVLPVFADSP